MIGLTLNVSNIALVMQVYDQIQVIRFDQISANPPETPVGDPAVLTEWVLVSGTIDYPNPAILLDNVTFYQVHDPIGEAEDWYSSRYFDSSTGTASAWSFPVLGGDGDLYYDPTYPAEITPTDEEKNIIKRIRLYIGDPLGLKREYGETALSSIHQDGKTYELDQTGWPVYITMGGKGYVNKFNPSVNGYKYLKFQEMIDTLCNNCTTVQTICEEEVTKVITMGVDIWYYTFRNSDRQILEAYDSCLPPIGLSIDNTTTQAYILQTAIDLLTKELLEDATEDGAAIDDDVSSYNPEPGLKIRKAMLDDLKKQLALLVRTLMFSRITGVLID